MIQIFPMIIFKPENPQGINALGILNSISPHGQTPVPGTRSRRGPGFWRRGQPRYRGRRGSTDRRRGRSVWL